MEFKDKLKELRKKKNISQTELAEKIYVSRSAVAKWENGLGLPSDDSLEAIAKYFCVSKSQLIGSVETENIFVDKNKKLVKQRLSFILTVCLFIAIFVAFGIGIYFLMIRSDEIGPQNTDIKVIGNMEYRLLSDEGGLYYEVYKAKGVNNDTYVLENEIDGVPVTHIGTQAFRSLGIDEVVFNDNMRCVDASAFVFAKIGTLRFNEGLETISQSAFYGTGYYDENVVFPASLKRIENYAFCLSTYIKTVTFGGNVEYIGDRAFENCFELQRVVFNSNLEMGLYSFARTNITRVTFNEPDIVLIERSFLYNYHFSQVEYNGTLAQWNAAVAHSDCFDKDGLYIKFVDSEEYKYTSRDYQTGMWR